MTTLNFGLDRTSVTNMSSIKIRTKQENGLTTVRMLITHPMETGRRRDDLTGRIVPAHFIREVKIEHNRRLVATCELSTAVSKDPYISIRFRGGKTGDRIRVTWADNLGNTDSAEGTIS
ncbi:thiosulfate oxidation carrier complex protein SoxZ [Methylocaldum sp.]|uniref:thiosulfate oxidation carrier complex protein SoxZ n=1 Tax=Methylocaldum sp. TaxID=1969727 RepID=UPI002D3344EA|nr:thiosulfate oxidation carrier complex protein SoxZ [Methylocaldum sp.]HYE34884.1 thiosulfate oxidation carrier complex protein SoxZ [Methylocaldum sp.]